MEHSMKKKDLQSGSVERTQEQPESANVMPVLKKELPTISGQRALLEATTIRELAFRLYEERGRQDGHDVEDWLEAESILLSQKKDAA